MGLIVRIAVLALLFAGARAEAQLLAPAPLRPDALMSALSAGVTGTLREDRIVPLFDFPRMTAIVLGSNWRLASAAQQAELAAQFKRLLLRSYSRALLEFRDQPIAYRPLAADAGEGDVTVRSLLRRPGAEPLSIDYQMADGAAGWRIYDVRIAGVSVVLAYRESFAATVRDEGIDGLIRALAQQNRQNQVQSFWTLGKVGLDRVERGVELAVAGRFQALLLA